LRANALSTTEIRISLILERAPQHPITLRFPVPILDTRVFLKLLHLELDGRPPQAPVEKILLEMVAVSPRKTQHGLFLPATPEPAKLEVTLARIRNLVGAANVGTPELVDTHRPDSFRMTVLRIAPWKNGAFSPQLVLRRFRPPRPVQVRCANDGHPE